MDSVNNEWEISDRYNYSFEDYFLLLNGHVLSIQVSYLGIFSDFENQQPFTLKFSQDVVVNGEIKDSHKCIEYYKTYQDVINRKKQLIYKFKSEQA